MVADSLLNDDDLRRWRACARRFWWHRQRHVGTPTNEPVDTAEADTSAEAAVVHGPSPDDALRASYPGAVRIAPPQTAADWPRALRETTEALAQAHMQQVGGAVLGACLASADGVQVRIDVLQRGEHGLRLFKLRYATVADEADVDAAALWAHVAAHKGLRVQGVGLLLVDIGFTYPGHGCYAGLFREVDLAPVLGSRPVAAWLTAMRACERGPQPSAEPGPQCQRLGGCDLVASCRAQGDAEEAAGEASLDVLGRELAAELRAQGHADLLGVPAHALSNARHRRAVLAIQQGSPVFEPALAALMRALPFPRRMLRFDTIGFAVPVWAGTQPYQVLPFQWTCDEEIAPGVLQRHGFLADAQGDPRRRFAQTLLAALGSHGPVFAYNAGFERNRIRDLAQRFDDLAPALESLLPRIVDLFQIARANAYHPAMRGSWSFKSVCRAFAPDLGADRFECHGEHSPQVVFARSLQRGLASAERQALRDVLLAHGQCQVAALRRLVSVFEGQAEPHP
jgi:hypothetical protein